MSILQDLTFSWTLFFFLLFLHTHRYETLEKGNIDGEGTLQDLSTEAFFSGVQGVCAVCSGLVRTVISGSLPVLGSGSIAEPRDICRNHLFAASKQDLSNPMRTDYDLDDDLMDDDGGDGMGGRGGGDGVGDVEGGDELDESSVRRHGTTVCLGVISELEDRMRSALREHGFSVPTRARLIDVIRIWKSHSNRIAPKAMGRSICRKFIRCTDDEMGGDESTPDKTLVDAQNKKSNAQSTLARLEKQITNIDANTKKVPKDQQAVLKAKKKKVRLSLVMKNLFFLFFLVVVNNMIICILFDVMMVVLFFLFFMFVFFVFTHSTRIFSSFLLFLFSFLLLSSPFFSPLLSSPLLSSLSFFLLFFLLFSSSFF